jgi:hypothetical protein
VRLQMNAAAISIAVRMLRTWSGVGFGMPVTISQAGAVNCQRPQNAPLRPVAAKYPAAASGSRRR